MPIFPGPDGNPFPLPDYTWLEALIALIALSMLLGIWYWIEKKGKAHETTCNSKLVKKAWLMNGFTSEEIRR